MFSSSGCKNVGYIKLQGSSLENTLFSLCAVSRGIEGTKAQIHSPRVSNHTEGKMKIRVQDIFLLEVVSSKWLFQ